MGERVAMISGANRGIGAAIAAHLVESGWLLSLGVRKPEGLAAPPGGLATLVSRFDAEDVASEVAWTEETVRRFGGIDAVIANAGVMIAKTAIEADDKDLDLLFHVNVRS